MIIRKFKLYMVLAAASLAFSSCLDKYPEKSTETQMFMGKSGAGTIFCRQIQTLKVYMAHCMRLSDAATSCLTMWRK